jgi:hypothetical protein
MSFSCCHLHRVVSDVHHSHNDSSTAAAMLAQPFSVGEPIIIIRSSPSRHLHLHYEQYITS